MVKFPIDITYNDKQLLAGLARSQAALSSFGSRATATFSRLGTSISNVGTRAGQLMGAPTPTAGLAGARGPGTRLPMRFLAGAVTPISPRYGLAIAMGFTPQVVMAGAMGAAVAGGVMMAVKAFREFETSMADVARVTGMSRSEIKELGDEFLKLSTVMPLAGKELASIGVIAGQMGIEGTKNISEFTQAVAMLSIATEFSTETAAEAFAVLGNIFELTTEDMVKMGSVIVDLSNKSIATAPQIVDFAQRVAGAGALLGMTYPEIFALGASIREVGGDVEVAGTAFTKIFTEMAMSPRAFAKQAGMSVKEWNKLISTDAMEAVFKWLKALEKMEPAKRARALDKLQIGGARLESIILRLAGNTESFGDMMEYANDEFERGTALETAYAAKLMTFDNRMKILSNTVNKVGISIGEKLVPGLELLVDWFTKNAESIKEDFLYIFQGIDPTSLLRSFVESLEGIKTWVTENRDILKEMFDVTRKSIDFAVDSLKLFLNTLFAAGRVAAWSFAKISGKDATTEYDKMRKALVRVDKTWEELLEPSDYHTQLENIKKANSALDEQAIAAQKVVSNMSIPPAIRAESMAQLNRINETRAGYVNQTKEIEAAHEAEKARGIGLKEVVTTAGGLLLLYGLQRKLIKPILDKAKTVLFPKPEKIMEFAGVTKIGKQTMAVFSRQFGNDMKYFARSSTGVWRQISKEAATSGAASVKSLAKVSPAMAKVMEKSFKGAVGVSAQFLGVTKIGKKTVPVFVRELEDGVSIFARTGKKAWIQITEEAAVSGAKSAKSFLKVGPEVSKGLEKAFLARTFLGRIKPIALPAGIFATILYAMSRQAKGAAPAAVAPAAPKVLGITPEGVVPEVSIPGKLDISAPDIPDVDIHGDLDIETPIVPSVDIYGNLVIPTPTIPKIKMPGEVDVPAPVIPRVKIPAVFDVESPEAEEVDIPGKVDLEKIPCVPVCIIPPTMPDVEGPEIEVPVEVETEEVSEEMSDLTEGLVGAAAGLGALYLMGGKKFVISGLEKAGTLLTSASTSTKSLAQKAFPALTTKLGEAGEVAASKLGILRVGLARFGALISPLTTLWVILDSLTTVAGEGEFAPEELEDIKKYGYVRPETISKVLEAKGEPPMEYTWYPEMYINASINIDRSATEDLLTLGAGRAINRTASIAR